MPGDRMPHDFPGARIERRLERQGAVPDVFEPVPLGATG
jgi:hypothetical protein